ncbi:MAG: DUF996 domain-containing protein [Pyrobaculum sp.]
MDFELAKILAALGGFIAAAGVVTHWTLVIVGAVLLYIGLTAYAEQLGGPAAKRDLLYWLIYVVFASVAYIVAYAAFDVAVWDVRGWWKALAFSISLVVGVASWIAGWVLQVAAAVRMRSFLDLVANKTGEDVYKIGNKLYWWGSILAIIFVGHVVLLVAYLVLAVGFLLLKPPGEAK